MAVCTLLFKVVATAQPPGPGRNDPAFTESIRQELARMLRSPIFAKAPSLSRFLSYLVDHALEDLLDPRMHNTCRFSNAGGRA